VRGKYNTYGKILTTSLIYYRDFLQFVKKFNHTMIDISFFKRTKYLIKERIFTDILLACFIFVVALAAAEVIFIR